MRLARRGFTFIEMLVVMIIIGVLASIAILKWIDLTTEAVAVSIAGDMHSVRIAAYSYYVESQTWPPDAPQGVVPPELKPYLPAQFSFSKTKYELDWDNLPGSGNGPTIAVSLAIPDARLLRIATTRLESGSPYAVIGGVLTYIIADGKTGS